MNTSTYAELPSNEERINARANEIRLSLVSGKILTSVKTPKFIPIAQTICINLCKLSDSDLGKLQSIVLFDSVATRSPKNILPDFLAVDCSFLEMTTHSVKRIAECIKLAAIVEQQQQIIDSTKYTFLVKRKRALAFETAIDETVSSASFVIYA